MNRLELLGRLAPELPRVTALMGGGGKTTLLFALGAYLAGAGKRALLTTTTHLGWRPEALAPKDVEALNERLLPGKAVLAGYPGGHKLTGIPVEWYPCLSADQIIAEADGSRGRPLKFHRSFEPAVPEGTGLLIQLAGLSALGRPVGEVLHGWEEGGFDPEQTVDEALVAALLIRGFAAAGFEGRRLALLNQADIPALAKRGGEIAERLRQNGIEAWVVRLKEDASCGF